MHYFHNFMRTVQYARPRAISIVLAGPTIQGIVLLPLSVFWLLSNHNGISAITIDQHDDQPAGEQKLQLC